jgi:RNA polymerase-associated protein CTR9
MYISLGRGRLPNSSFPILVRVPHVLYPSHDAEIHPVQDDMTSQKTKEEHYKEAAMCINASDNALRQGESDGGVLFLLARGVSAFPSLTVSFLDCVGIHQMATRSMEDALRCFDAVLNLRPTNVIALLGRVCLAHSSDAT